MPLVPWNIGEDERECLLAVTIHPAERRKSYDGNGEGYPGSPAYGEIDDARIIENGIRRELTEEEWGLVYADAEAIECEAFEIACRQED